VIARADRDRLHDVLSHIGLAREAELRMSADFSQHHVEARLTYAALMYCLIVIGEAVRQLSEGTKAAHPEVPWRQIVGMRNALAHEHFRVEAPLVRATVDEPMARLEVACLALLSE